jgi:hypothetical protein
VICKERDQREHPENDVLSRAGADAERQMAFYLRRAFVDDPHVHVFHDLRIQDATGDTAQMDHLVLHPHGIIIIESKSFYAGVSVNECGEWVRFWNNRPQGMPSPIEQVRRQIILLRRVLQANKVTLRKKMFGIMQCGFRNCPFDILVAISDNANIKRKIVLKEVVKADQVPSRIEDIVTRHKKAAAFFSSKEERKDNAGMYVFAHEEIAAITSFLLTQHTPLRSDTCEKVGLPSRVREQQAHYTATPHLLPDSEPAPDADLGICDKCGEQCLIKWGRYGYYWKCIHCDSNMAIKEFCSSCRQKIKLRKDGNRFFKYCDTCKTPAELYCEFE